MTIEELARQLGVSKSTVSRALSGKGRIGEATRERIREQARLAGICAEQRQRTGNIAVVIPADAYTVSIPFFSECLLGVSEAARHLEYQVMVTAGAVGDISGLQRLVEGKKTDGVVLMRNVEGDQALKYLVKAGIPTGLAGSCDYESVIQVDTDNRLAARQMVSFLIGQGYRHFALVMGDGTYRVNQERLQGCLEAMDKAGVPGNVSSFHLNVTQMELADSIVGEVLSRKIECVVCGDDVICTRIMSGLQAEGYRIPRDISTVSLSNSASLDCFSPAVTAVRSSARQIGYTLGRELIRCLRGETYNRKVMLGFELLIRKSIKKMDEV